MIVDCISTVIAQIPLVARRAVRVVRVVTSMTR